MRTRRIGDRCEQCDSTDGPFVLQHFSHYHGLSEPPSKNAIVWDLMREHGAYPLRPTVQRPACPACDCRNPTERKKLRPKWRCIGCRHEFDEPAMVEVPVNRRTGKDEFDRYRQEILHPAFDAFEAAHSDLVEERYCDAMAEYEVERKASYDTYVSGEGTTTFCKKCAFLWDVKGMRLCGSCRKQYHLFNYNTCFNCLPESRKEELKQRSAFNQDMELMMDRIEELYEDASDSPTST